MALSFKRMRAKRAPGDSDSPRGAAIGFTTLSIALVVFIVLMLNYLAFRHYVRWDWTSEGLFTLSERTKKVVRGLDEPVHVHVFLSEAEPNFRDVRQLLERYRAVSTRIVIHYVDPDRDPAQYQSLVERFGIAVGMTETGQMLADVAAVVSKGSKKWSIPREDLLGLDVGSLEDERGPRIDVKAEQALTGAIVQVTSGRATGVCVTSGHGEWSVEGANQRSLMALQDELRRLNVEVRGIATLGLPRVPNECDAVFVIGPLRPFADEEVSLLQQYLRRGGNLLLAIDPIAEGGRIQPSGFEALGASVGIRIDGTLVHELDRARLVRADLTEAFIVVDYGEHPITDVLGRVDGRTLVYVAQSVRAANPEHATELLLTSERGFATRALPSADDTKEPEPGASDIRGPVSLAVAAEVARATNDEAAPQASSGPAKGRIVVIGDADFLAPENMNTPQFVNRDLANAITGWLTRREALIAIAPKQVRAQAILMTPEDLMGLLLRVVVLLPGAALLLGVAVWWSRRA